MNNFKDDLVSAVVPLLKLLTLTVMGLILAHPKTQIIPRATFKLLNKLVFVLFLPSLAFIYLGQSITIKNLALWWFIPVNVLISTLLGFILGVVVVFLCRPPPKFIRFTIVMTAFGNTGNLPIAILGSVCRAKDSPFGSDCHRRGVAYVSFAQWVSVILVYTLVYHMMEPPLEYYEVIEEGEEENEENGGNVSPVVDGNANEDSKTPYFAKIFQSMSSFASLPEDETQAHETSHESIRCFVEPRIVRKIKIVAERTPIKHIFQPPIIASLLAIIVGSVPQAHSLFFGHDAPLTFISDSLEILGGAMVPSVMLILGGMLAEGPNESRLGLRTTIGVTIARLLVLPLLGLGVVALADKMHLLIHGDVIYRYVLLLQYATPSAILLGAVANMRGYAVSESSALLFWQHIFALFSLSFFIFVYTKLVLYL